MDKIENYFIKRRCIECGNIIPKSRNKFITCSKKCSNKRATTPSNKRRRIK